MEHLKWPMVSSNEGHIARTLRFSDPPDRKHCCIAMAYSSDIITPANSNSPLLNKVADPQADYRRSDKPTNISFHIFDIMSRILHFTSIVKHIEDLIRRPFFQPRRTHPPKLPPSYLYRSSLAPQLTPLRQTILGYKAMHARPRRQSQQSQIPLI
jgi:hypothetical protein